MNKLIGVKTAFEKEYSEHLELYKKETGGVLDTKDIHTFAKFYCWLTRRMRASAKSSTNINRIFTDLRDIHYNDEINFDNGICIDPKDQTIYIPSKDGNNAAGNLFHIELFKTNSQLSKYLETDPAACDMINTILTIVDSMRDKYEYDNFVRKYSDDIQ